MQLIALIVPQMDLVSSYGKRKAVKRRMSIGATGTKCSVQHLTDLLGISVLIIYFSGRTTGHSTVLKGMVTLCPKVILLSIPCLTIVFLRNSLEA
jgi:hypothetical protein